MTNEEKLNEISSMTVLAAPTVPTYELTIAKAEKEISRIIEIREEIKNALVAAEWLVKSGYTLGATYAGVRVNISKKCAYITASYDEESFIRVIPVVVTDANEVAKEQCEVWKGMTLSERILFVLRERVAICNKRIAAAESHLAWLKAECEE